jgi:adenylate kinase family enzyme
MGLPKSQLSNFKAARVAVVGAVGCGKSSLARMLAQRLGLPYVELDSLRYQAHWEKVDEQTFFDEVVRNAGANEWVIDGNYEVARDVVWIRAQVLIWVDYPLRTVLWRLLKRTAQRLATREVFSNGNRESFWRLLGPNSIVLWAIRSHGPRRDRFEQLLAKTRYEHLRVFRLRSPFEADACLIEIESTTKQTADESKYDGEKNGAASGVRQRNQ